MTVLQAPAVDGDLTARRPVRLDSIARATADIRDGRPVIVLDDDSPDSRGQLIFAAEDAHVCTQTELNARGVRARELATRCRTGEVHELLPGTYCTRMPTTIDRCLAVTLWRPDAVLSHGTAAWLHGMLDEPAVIDAYVRELPVAPVPAWLRLRVPDCGIYFLCTRRQRSMGIMHEPRRHPRRVVPSS